MNSTTRLLLLVAAFFPAISPATEERPNIIVILADDMGYSDLGSFGGEIETPNLDTLAGNGLRFTEFYNTARCWSTRAALMSGCYVEWLTSPKNVSIPEVLKTAGYDTGMVGKWHLAGKASGRPQAVPEKVSGNEGQNATDARR